MGGKRKFFCVCFLMFSEVGIIDEADMTLIGKSMDQFCFLFDEENQQIVFKPSSFFGRIRNTNDLPNYIKEFMDNDKFDVTKYFNTFVEEMHAVLESKNIFKPQGLKLSTKFIPCEVCRSHEDAIPQDVRCRHVPDCQAELKTGFLFTENQTRSGHFRLFATNT